MNVIQLIAIIGMPGSGKSEAADFFRSKGLPVLRFGDQVDIGLKEYNLEKNEKNERWYREKLRKDSGMAAMAIKIEPRIHNQARYDKTIILDGLYSWEEYIFLKKIFSHLLLLCIWAPADIRYSRLSKRPVRPLNLSDAKSRDISEIENLNKGGPIAMADYIVRNDSGLDDFIRELEKFHGKFCTI